MKKLKTKRLHFVQMKFSEIKEIIDDNNRLKNEIDDLSLEYQRLEDQLLTRWHDYLICLKIENFNEFRIQLNGLAEVFDSLRRCGVKVNCKSIRIIDQKLNRVIIENAKID